MTLTSNLTVLIKIWKKREHFTIIIFCKQSKSEIRIEKIPIETNFWIWFLVLICNLGYENETFWRGARSWISIFSKMNTPNLDQFKMQERADANLSYNQSADQMLRCKHAWFAIDNLQIPLSSWCPNVRCRLL